MKRLFLIMVFLAVSIQADAAKMSSYTENTTPNDDVYFIGVDPNDTTQTVNGSNYRYSLSSILGSGLLDFNVNSLTVSGTGDSWLELENNTSFTDTLTGKYGLRFYNGALQQIINGTASSIGSGSFAFDTFPTYEDSAHSSGIAVNGTTLAVYSETASKWLTVALTDSLDPAPVLYTLTVTDPGNGDVISSTDTFIDCGDGATDCTHDYEADATPELTATAAAGREFAEWSGDATDTSTTTNPDTITMDAAKSVSATFSVAASGLEDTFTDTDSTALASHTSDSSHTWTQNGGAAVRIHTNRAESAESTGVGLYYSSFVPTDADYSVSVDTMNDSASGAPIFPAIRCSTSAATMYAVRWDGTTTWELMKWVSGTRTVIGTYAGDAPTTQRTIVLSASGSTISVSIGGVSRISVTDTDITATGRPGIGTWYNDASDYHIRWLDNYEVTD